MISIRSADRLDAGNIARVHVESWRESYAEILPADFLAALSVDQREENWLRILDDSNQATFVAAIGGGDVVGFGNCGKQRSAELPYAGEYYALYVLRAAQRQGIGRALMAAMSMRLVELGLPTASVWVIRENTPGRAFYESLGGSVVAEREDQRDSFTIREVAYGWN